LDKHQIIFFYQGQFDKDCLIKVTEEIEHEFNCSVRLKPFETDIELYYDELRRQYNGNQLLHHINELDSDAHIKKMGLFQVDLFVPILTFIFGQAIFKGSAGVVSVYRLRNEQYGLTTDYDLLFLRFKKVIMHELGHLYGLKHCYIPNCVMRSSTYVEDIDQKRAHFCSNCHAELLDLFEQSKTE